MALRWAEFAAFVLMLGYPIEARSRFFTATKCITSATAI